MRLRVSQLSGGERRYMEAKLLLLGDAKFVLLDEPFDYVSPFLVDKLMELIAASSRDKGIVVTDHRYEHVLKVATRIMLLRDGALMELSDRQGLVEQGYLRELM